MAQADEHGARAPFLQKFSPRFMENNEGLAAFLASDFHVLPAKLRANAGSKGLGNGFFGGEARGQKWRGHVVRKTIADLVGMQNALEESLPKTLVRSLD